MNIYYVKEIFSGTSCSRISRIIKLKGTSRIVIHEVKFIEECLLQLFVSMNFNISKHILKGHTLLRGIYIYIYIITIDVILSPW